MLTDGRYAVCLLDRNGLRPSRWVTTKNGYITLASEIGVWDYKPEDVIAKGASVRGRSSRWTPRPARSCTATTSTTA